MTTVVVGCLLVAALVAAVVVSWVHNPTAATVRTPAASTSGVPSAAVSRVQAATQAAGVATLLTRSKLDDISGIPTLANVTVIINPYVSSLQRYETALRGTTVPAGARSSVNGVRSLVQQDAQFLSTINGLPSLDLGAYLAEVSKRSTQLQMAFSAVEADLHTATG